MENAYGSQQNDDRQGGYQGGKGGVLEWIVILEPGGHGALGFVWQANGTGLWRKVNLDFGALHFRLVVISLYQDRDEDSR